MLWGRGALSGPGTGLGDRQSHPLGEPRPEGEEWVEWGGERIFTVGYTEGGAPFGLTEPEFREDGRQMNAGEGWARAAAVFRRALVDLGAEDVKDAVGRVNYLGEGLTYRTYGATCLFPDGQDKQLVVRLPHPGAKREQEEQARRETVLLRHLAAMDLPFRAPRVVATVPVEDGLAAVQEWVRGIPADLRASRFPGGRPWEVVGGIAAAVHALDPGPLRCVLPGFETRRGHALAFARQLESLSGPEGDEARAWVKGHLPPEESSCLLHGDLLGQNIHLSWDDESPGVVDWSEAQLGDPAYDLAIVTRGVRRPFQAAKGLYRLLEEYNRFASRALSVADVHLYEICLRGRLYLDAAETHGARSPHANNVLKGVTGVLRRAQAL